MVGAKIVIRIVWERINMLSKIDTNIEKEWIKVNDGVKMLVLRLEPGEVRVLLKFAARKGYSKHRHPSGEEVFVLEGTYSDMGVDYEAGSYIYYPPNSEHAPISKNGCTIMVMSPEKPEIL
jgi:anti-sigma factor ChrR (cupin superfamily)